KIPQQCVHCWILARKIDRNDRDRPFAYSAVSAAPEIRLHRNAVGVVRQRELLHWRDDAHCIEVGFSDTRGGISFIGRQGDGVLIVLLFQDIENGYRGDYISLRVLDLLTIYFSSWVVLQFLRFFR